ncbi:Hypothetical predicted protein [Podarcis lilfordi]|uniref:Uncharacterized protein n=1 Tax=Podarcis lilfordi TaxID=74358 RepID=A0AA35PM12_9SAUR|nr:Hypothetical predicted protein [Podarcis lilfordi]
MWQYNFQSCIFSLGQGTCDLLPRAADLPQRGFVPWDWAEEKRRALAGARSLEPGAGRSSCRGGKEETSGGACKAGTTRSCLNGKPVGCRFSWFLSLSHDCWAA